MFGIKYLKFQPTQYVIRYRRGRIVKEGPGLAFYFVNRTTSIDVIPLSSTESPFMFEQITADYQPVTIQGQVIFRIVDPKKIAQLLNFTLNPRGNGYISDDPQKLPSRITNIARVLTKQYFETLKLKDTLKSTEALSQKLNAEITENPEVSSLGVEILGLSILAVKPNAETARALEAESREQILKQADDAIYERRNASIEQERRIKENELNTEIAVENKKKQIRETQMEAEQLIQEKQNELKIAQMHAEITLEEDRKQLVETKVANSRSEADAKAYELSAVLKAMQGVDNNVITSLANLGMQPDKLIAMAFQQIAGKAEKIGQLNISPDLLQQLMDKKQSDG
jgi:hypothetical protein